LRRLSRFSIRVVS